jgi:single-stranded DNA-binding protein
VNASVDYFFDISAWRELGETVANYMKKGDPILIEGRQQYLGGPGRFQAEHGRRRGG